MAETSVCLQRSTRRICSFVEIKYVDSHPEANAKAQMWQSDGVRRNDMSTSHFELDTLRTDLLTGFAGSDLGIWIISHISKKYKGSVWLSTNENDDGVCLTTVRFEFPYVNAHCASCGAGEASPVLTTGCAAETAAAVGDVALLKGVEICADENNRSPSDVNRSLRRNNVSSESQVHVEESQDKISLEVLVVDDVPSNRKLLSRLLTVRGHHCIMAADGDECVRIVTQTAQRIDIICMDYEMPVKDGPTAARELRTNGCTIPILGVTGNALQHDVDYYIAQGANAVFSKPVDIDRLDRLMSVLHKDRMLSQSPDL